MPAALVEFQLHRLTRCSLTAAILLSLSVTFSLCGIDESFLDNELFGSYLWSGLLLMTWSPCCGLLCVWRRVGWVDTQRQNAAVSCDLARSARPQLSTYGSRGQWLWLVAVACSWSSSSYLFIWLSRVPCSDCVQHTLRVSLLISHSSRSSSSMPMTLHGGRRTCLCTCLHSVSDMHCARPSPRH